MKIQNMIGVVLILAGGACIFSAQRIALRVSEGVNQVNTAQNQVDSSQKIFALNPVTKQLGQPLTQSAQERIDHAHEQIEKYSLLAKKIRMIGIFLLGVGLGILVWSYKKFRIRKHPRKN